MIALLIAVALASPGPHARAATPGSRNTIGDCSPFVSGVVLQKLPHNEYLVEAYKASGHSAAIVRRTRGTYASTGSFALCVKDKEFPMRTAHFANGFTAKLHTYEEK